MHRFIGSAALALSGIRQALKTQRHMRIHFVCAAIVVTAGVCMQLSRSEWAWIAIAITSVISAELFNTAIENVVDLACPEVHPLAKSAKDTAAGAVLVMAAGAAVIGLLVLGPHMWALLAQKG